MDPTAPDDQILLGDEAVARGAIDAGLSAAYAYPGTPSTEIFQTLQDQARALGLPVQGLWSTNEKVALEEGVGVSYAGRRALVAMKHVGLNVAADPFMNVAVSGTHGGLVVVVADDAQYFFIAVTTTAPTTQTGTPPSSGGFLGMYVTHPGLALTGQTTLAVNLGMDENFFRQATNKNIDVFVVGSTTYSNGSGGNCNVTLKGSVTPTTSAMITYTLALSSMTLVQPCNGGGFNSGVSSVAQALAQPIGAVNTQFTFPNVNMTVNSGTGGANVYATGLTRGKTEFR